MKTPSNKQYLGDGVYADFDGYHIQLTTENGVDTTNQIALEPDVMTALERYAKSLRAVPEKPAADTSHPYLSALKSLSDKYGKRASVLAPFAASLQEARVPEPNQYSEGLHFYGLNHDQVIAGIRILGGKWRKELNGEKIDYHREEMMDGLHVCFYQGSPPPSCKIVEEEIEVPEKVIPAHVTKVKRMICKEAV